MARTTYISISQWPSVCRAYSVPSNKGGQFNSLIPYLLHALHGTMYNVWAAVVGASAASVVDMLSSGKAKKTGSSVPKERRHILTLDQKADQSSERSVHFGRRCGLLGSR